MVPAVKSWAPTLPPAWKRLLPAWPVVPPRLWLTAGATVVVLLNLVFAKEIWTHARPAELWSWALLIALLLGGGCQAVWVLLRWPEDYTGPLWIKLLIKAGAWFVGIGISILLFLVFIAGCMLLSSLLAS